MSSSTIISLTFASQQVAIYGGLFVFILGIIGNPLTLFVFVSLRTFRESSCAFYLTILSFLNIFNLFTGPFTFILSSGFSINWTNTSLFYCKFRSFCLQFFLLTSFACLCLAVIDQFLATCTNPRWHQWNNIKLARRLIIGAALAISLYGIPFLLYYNHVPSSVTGGFTCMITNPSFQIYYTLFHLPFLGIGLPVLVIVIFGMLAYRNVRQIAYRTVPLVRQELDKQLTTMVLIQVICDAIVLAPVAIFNLFNTIHIKSGDQVFEVQLNLIRNIIAVPYYVHFVSSFYIYVIISKRFRQQLSYAVSNIYFNRFQHQIANNKQIHPQT